MVKQAKQVVSVCCVIVMFYVVLNVIGIGCPIKFLTGLSCAGCGMTRAYISLLRGDLKSAFYYHPLFLVPLFYVAYYIVVRNNVSHCMDKKIMYFIIFIFISVYVYRLMFLKDTVVTFDFKAGAIFKLLLLFK